MVTVLISSFAGASSHYWITLPAFTYLDEYTYENLNYTEHIDGTSVLLPPQPRNPALEQYRVQQLYRRLKNTTLPPNHYAALKAA